MSGEGGDVWKLAVMFSVLSLFSFGSGTMGLLPEIQRQVVGSYGWMSVAEFTDLFAIAQAAPGPGLLLVTLVGFHVAAVVGGIVATLAYVLPAATVTMVGNRLIQGAGKARWITIVQNAVVPIALGLLAAGFYTVARSSLTSVLAIAIFALAIVLGFVRRVHPLLSLFIGAAVGGVFLR